jgi:TetR/AcrR family transcriptional regulator, regulator of cefoperazone and chloramphenicol sensitivity
LAELIWRTAVISEQVTRCFPIGNILRQAGNSRAKSRFMKNDAKPRRRPKAGGYLRGDETRAQILANAIRMFGEQGYDRTSTRDIAIEANVHPPALQYYFGGKDGLHRACVRLVADRASGALAPTLEAAARAIQAAQVGGAIAALGALVDALIDLVAGSGSASLSRFFHRARRDGTGPGVDLFRETLICPVASAVEGLLMVITGSTTSTDESRVRAFLLLSQVYAVENGRETLLGSLYWRKRDPAKIGIIKRQIHEHIAAAVLGSKP